MISATQKVHFTRDECVVEMLIADPSAEVLPGIKWGRHDRFCTPAYWRLMAAYHEESVDGSRFRLGQSLTEEIAACLLGGFGMSADIGLAAFQRTRERGLLARASTEHEILSALLEPLEVGMRRLRYRYPGQKAKYLSRALQKIHSEECPESSNAKGLREWLLGFEGIGLKTASWIVRNFLSSDEVAILDLHVIRACRIMGVFAASHDVARHYLEMEEKFLAFSKAIGASSALLDAMMWEQMRTVPLSALGSRSAA